MNHTEKTVALLKRGYITAMECASRGGCLSLSQRVSELRRAGNIVGDVWRVTNGGARVKAYRLLKGPAMRAGA